MFSDEVQREYLELTPVERLALGNVGNRPQGYGWYFPDKGMQLFFCDDTIAPEVIQALVDKGMFSKMPVRSRGIYREAITHYFPLTPRGRAVAVFAAYILALELRTVTRCLPG